MVKTKTQLLEEIGKENGIRITEVRLTPLSYQPSDGSYIHICGPVVLSKMDAGFIEVFTNAGITGIGPAVNGFDADYNHLVGESPFDVDRLDLAAGVDVACWDIIGRVKDKPVYELLAGGKVSRHCPVYASGGVMWTYYDRGDGQPFGVEELMSEALEYKSLGFNTFKWRPGTDWEEAGIRPKELGQICRQLREAVGPDFDLGLEKKGYDSWTWEECQKMAPIIDELEFLFFEQPMGDEGPAQFDDYRQLKELMPRVQLWGGERFRSLEEARPWIEEGIYDAVQSDCVYLGITGNWEIAQLAAKHGVKMVTHNWATPLGTMCDSHLVAGTEAGHMCEFFMYPNGMRYGLMKEPMRPVHGVIELSAAPGFDMEVIDDPQSKFPYVAGPNTHPNPLFPHAFERAQEREARVVARYER
ncbi:MAG: mandelate racemase/muconate lactonizing enzyme family protein [Candidatus Latescibacterota bacterium]|nr:mandelate racemase/muconate lactonizing enzyme family protein [Candidatus Latescibacterota bacterium]